VFQEALKRDGGETLRLLLLFGRDSFLNRKRQVQAKLINP